MREVLSSPGRALVAGLVLAGLMLAAWMAVERGDALGLASFLLRAVHVLGAMVWIGLVWFVNLIQHEALGEADATERAAIVRLVVPRVAHSFRHASHLTVATGALLLATTGYVLTGPVFAAEVHLPASRELMLWLGALGGIAMWVIVHVLIWKHLKVVLGIDPGDAEARATARATAGFWARVNLMLAIPVTLSMVAAAHLY
jgi:uncharacterized membrane protein